MCVGIVEDSLNFLIILEITQESPRKTTAAKSPENTPTVT